MPKEARKASVVITCDFRKIDAAPAELHQRTLKVVIDAIMAATSQYTSSFTQLYEIFREEIDREFKGALAPYSSDRTEREKKTSELLVRFQDYSSDHLRKVVRYLRVKCNLQTIIILDNMDQKSEELQDRLYQVAQEFVFSCKAIVAIALRESTYQRMLRSPNFNAFSSVEFHVKGQPLDIILEKRLQFLSAKLSTEKVSVVVSRGRKIDSADLDRFLNLIRISLLGNNADPQILGCVSSVSNGNIREQLGMLYSFFVSGQTKIDEYFWEYAKDVSRAIPFHEVLHSLLYDDQKVFQETVGHRFMNVFAGNPTGRANHFMALRILAYLHYGLGQAGELKSTDFVHRDEVSQQFEAFGWQRAEVGFQFRRLTQFGLLMPESGDPIDKNMEQPFALTKCGLYYLTRLYREFSYIAAMACDTSMSDMSVICDIADILKRSIYAPKIPLQARREIAARFVGYLDAEEKRELAGSVQNHAVLGGVRFVPGMITTLHNIGV
jgi:hypothetical protein